MMQADAYEVNELISSLHFWDQFLIDKGKETVLDSFWKTRRNLRMDAEESTKAGLGYVGVLDLLKGIIISPDDHDGAAILVSDIPVIVVQSTEDVFVDPKNAGRWYRGVGRYRGAGRVIGV